MLDEKTGEQFWMRETEGPEDIPILGRHEFLYRRPTHWLPLIESPIEDFHAGDK
jgi:hypothetical protein